MGLRCSLLGHSWGEPTVERERSESDAEVVTTVRELRVCARCGAREVLGENVEVTAMEPPEDETVIEDAETGERTVVERDDQTETRATADGEHARVDDDAVILDDDGGTDPDRDPGEWPDPDLPAEDEDLEPGPWPEDAPSAEGARADPPSPDAPAAGRSDAGDATAATASGDVPASDPGTGRNHPHEPADGEEDDVEFIDTGGPAEDPTGGASADEQAEPTDDGATTEDELDPDVEVYCPNCGFVVDERTPSLRGGDSCPRCRDVYLAEREDGR